MHVIHARVHPPAVSEGRDRHRCGVRRHGSVAGTLAARARRSLEVPRRSGAALRRTLPLRAGGEGEGLIEDRRGFRRERHASPRDSGHHHTLRAPLRGPSRRGSRHRSRQASSPDPRHGGSSSHADDGGDPGTAIDLPHPLPRVPGQQPARVARAHGARRPEHSRLDELQRVDGRAALTPAPRGRSPAGRRLGPDRRRRRQRKRAQPSAGQGDGRRPDRLRAERRGDPSGERLPLAAHPSRLEWQHERQVAPPPQGGGPGIPDADGRHGATHSAARRHRPTSQPRHGSEVGHNLAFRGAAASGARDSARSGGWRGRVGA